MCEGMCQAPQFAYSLSMAQEWVQISLLHAEQEGIKEEMNIASPLLKIVQVTCSSTMMTDTMPFYTQSVSELSKQ